MKNLLYFIISVLLLLDSSSRYVRAQSPTAADSEESTAAATPLPTVKKEVEDLKERLANKINELTSTEKTAIYGRVLDTTITTLTVETETKNLKIELTDEIKAAEYKNGKKTMIKVEDIKKDDLVTIFGDYDKTLDLVKAKIIFREQEKSTSDLVGKISDIDRDKYTFTVTGPNQQLSVFDYERTTKAYILGPDLKITKTGYSGLEIGDQVFTHLPTGESETKTAIKIYLISVFRPTPTQIASPSSALDEKAQ